MKKLLQLINKDQLILVLILFLILSNLFTYLKIDKQTSKEKKLYKNTIDSLKKSNNKLQLVLIQESAKRDKIIERDELIINDLMKLQEKNISLIKEQKNIINKYKNLTDKDLLNKLDSMYDANH